MDQPSINVPDDIWQRITYSLVQVEDIISLQHTSTQLNRVTQKIIQAPDFWTPLIQRLFNLYPDLKCIISSDKNPRTLFFDLLNKIYEQQLIEISALGLDNHSSKKTLHAIEKKHKLLERINIDSIYYNARLLTHGYPLSDKKITRTPVQIKKNPSLTTIFNDRFAKSFSAMYRGFNESRKEVISNYIHCGADINVFNEKGQARLHVAAKALDYDLMKFLIEMGAKVNLPDFFGNTIMHYLIIHKDVSLDFIYFLITEHNANINTQNNYLITPIYLFIGEIAQNHINFHQDTFDFLIHKCNADVNIVCIKGLSILHLLIGSFRNYNMQLIPAIRYLLNHTNMNVNLIDINNQTALHYVGTVGNSKLLYNVISLLIHKGAKIDALDINQKTPLFIAIENMELKTAEFLIDSGASLNHPDLSILSYFIYYYNKKNYEFKGLYRFMTMLIQNGADVNFKPKNTYSPLQQAVISGLLNIVKFLIQEQHADEEILSNLGENLLHFCALHNQIAIAKWLMENTAISSQALDFNGKSACQYAIENNNYTLATLFKTKEIGYTNFISEEIENKTMPILNAFNVFFKRFETSFTITEDDKSEKVQAPSSTPKKRK